MTFNSYQFTNAWFEFTGAVLTESILPQIKPTKILEIGSFEGRSTCAFIESVGDEQPLEIHCVDNWLGGVEHDDINMRSVESRFLHNTNLSIGKAKNKIKLVTHKGNSDVELAKLLAGGKQSYFDFIYVDGSHQAPDVLCDAVLAFRLLRPGGIIAFDDYIWFEGDADKKDPMRCPKPAIDSFVNIYWRKIEVIMMAPLYQLYAQKISD